MLTLLSFFLGVLVSFSVCWLEDEDEEELVLALESSSDIATPPPHTPTWRGDTMGRGEQTVNTNTHRERLLTISLCVWVMLLLKDPRVSLSSLGPTATAGGAVASPALVTPRSRGKETLKASSQKASADERRVEPADCEDQGSSKQFFLISPKLHIQEKPSPPTTIEPRGVGDKNGTAPVPWVPERHVGEAGRDGAGG